MTGSIDNSLLVGTWIGPARHRAQHLTAVDADTRDGEGAHRRHGMHGECGRHLGGKETATREIPRLQMDVVGSPLSSSSDSSFPSSSPPYSSCLHLHRYIFTMLSPTSSVPASVPRARGYQAGSATTSHGSIDSPGTRLPSDAPEKGVLWIPANGQSLSLLSKHGLVGMN